MSQALSIAEIRALDCPTIMELFPDHDAVIEQVRSYLMRYSPSLDNANLQYLFAFAYARYEGVSIHAPVVFERSDRDYKLWARTQTLPTYIGSYFKKALEDEVARAA